MNIEIVYTDERYLSRWGRPEFKTRGANGLDLRASTEKPTVLLPQKSYCISTGICLNMNGSGLGALLTIRSGLSINNSLSLVNGVGVIDNDYQGEVIACIRNGDREKHYVIDPGDRIVQLIFIPLIQPLFREVKEFSFLTERGERGIGSTGEI